MVALCIDSLGAADVTCHPCECSEPTEKFVNKPGDIGRGRRAGARCCHSDHRAMVGDMWGGEGGESSTGGAGMGGGRPCTEYTV